MRKVLLAMLVAAPSLAACLGALPVEPAGALPALTDLPTLHPPTDWYSVDGEPTGTHSAGVRTAATGAAPFHTLDEIEARIEEWNRTHPGLVEVHTIGVSRLGRPLRDVVLTEESIPGPKPVILLDGGHHGNENAGVEMGLYTADFLLANHARNATVRDWLARYEIHLVPVVNPDGYVAQTRGNALGVNLNRNYDLDWGNQLGASNAVMGTLAHAANRSMPSVPIVLENSGPEPFSEPESAAMRDLMAEIGPRTVLYLTHHTPTNALAAPWSAFDPPFPLPPEHHAVFEEVLRWTRTETDYRAGKAQWGNFSAGLPYAASGSSQDYLYATYGAASFTLEVEIWYTSVFSRAYAERVFLSPYAGLGYWMEATLPIPLYLLANADHFGSWTHPDRSPPLPEGETPPLPDPAWMETLGFVRPEHEGALGDPGRFFGDP